MQTRTLTRITLHVEPDPDPDVSYLDADGLQDYHDGNLGYVGVYASAEYTLDGTRQTLRTGGLWGIESWYISSDVDRSEEYISTCVAEAQLELIDLLCAVGFTAADIDAAPVTTTWDEEA